MFFGLTLPLVIVICRNRSLWFDEAALGYNIVSRSYSELLQPLTYSQVAPIGYLVLSKACNSLFGYNDIAIRIPSIIAYLCLFFILGRRASRSPEWLLRFVFIVSAAGVIKYAFELKQYIFDVLLMVVLLVYGDLILSSNWLSFLFSSVSVLLSNVTFIQLPLFSLLFGLKHSKSHASLLWRFLLVLLPLVIYYFSFAYNHPAHDSMHRYWSQHFLFSRNENAFAFVLSRLYGVVHAGYFTPVFQLLWIPYLVGLNRYIRERRYSALAATQLPIVAHLAFSALRLYPFDGGRLTLYLIVPFVYVAADGLHVAVTSLRKWHVALPRYDIGSLLGTAAILAVVGNAFAYALLVEQREDIRPVFSELEGQTQSYKQSVPLHFIPSSRRQFDYYEAQSHAAGNVFLEDYQKLSHDKDWRPFLRDVLLRRKVALVFSHSGRQFDGQRSARGILNLVNRKLGALDPSNQYGLHVSRFTWSKGAGLLQVEHCEWPKRMKTGSAADAGGPKAERLRPLPTGDGAAPAMHDPVWQRTARHRVA